MKSAFSILAYFSIGYLIGMWIGPENVFVENVLQTEWDNIYVYLYLFVWPIMVAIHIFWYVIAAIACIFVLFLILDR